MRKWRDLVLWVLAAALGLALLAGLYRQAFPFLPRDWSFSRQEAVAIALERLRDLGEPVERPYVVALLDNDPLLENRLDAALERRGAEALWRTGLPERVASWAVLVYARGAQRDDWTYLARVSLSGKVLSVRLRLDPQAAGAAISEQTARDRADAFLVSQGIDLSRYDPPQFRSQQLAARTDLAVRYRDRQELRGEGLSHGLEVIFAGDRLAGFQPWVDDPQERQLQQTFQNLQFVDLAQLVLIYALMVALAVPFAKRYHAGEIGVRRGTQVFLLVAAVGLVLTLMIARPQSQGIGFGFSSRLQTTLIYIVVWLVFQILPLSLLAFFGWSLGESICRERWGHKLAAFDALFQRNWSNATVARSSLRGVAAGLALAGAFTAVLLALRQAGASPLASVVLDTSSLFPGLELLGRFFASGFPGYLVVLLCVAPVAVRKLGKPLGTLVAALLGSACLFPVVVAVPIGWGLLAVLVFGAVPVLLFLFYDFLTALLAGLVAMVLIFGYPLLAAGDGSLQANGWLALAVAAVPLLVSLRALGSGREFIYRYEDIPPHVRRIAERERQRVELETARRIQSSILPELPPMLLGVEIAHAYLPASEVGGDFYDVLALEDGRLAVAIGDVAGHGVSSGLVMSMAKSALAVQVTFDPEVEPVFRTLNRVVHQTARKRLLATLCYLVLDPRSREMVFASAGHLFPYRVTPDGKVEALESIAYPLGVRGYLQIQPRTARLQPGDALFLFSDGLVEAKPEGSEEVFGFERLERSLARHAGGSPESLRDGVLADVGRFAGNVPREDDQTVLVLRLP
ncbi:MAG TPA: PP2C family protein-serine/threonine phosphatase [Thermoanaerobaculia bacterium]